MFYVIETEYVGPNSQDRLDSHTYHIQTCPGRKNMSHEECTDEWLGTTNDWYEAAHGEYETLEAAKSKIEELTGGEYREQDLEEHEMTLAMDDDGSVTDFICYSVLAGSLESWDAENSQNWCYEGMKDCISATSNYTDIAEFVADCAELLKESENGELDEEAVEKMALEYRDDLRDDEFYQDAFTTSGNWSVGELEQFMADIGFSTDDPDESFGQRAFAVWEWMELENEEAKADWISNYNDWLDE